MNEWEWMTCEDPYDMGTEITVKQASLVSAAIRSNGLLCELPNPNSMCIHYWHEGGCHGMSFHKKSQPLVCNLIREVVGNPFRPVYHVQEFLTDAQAAYHVRMTAENSVRNVSWDNRELMERAFREELNGRVFRPEWLNPSVRDFAANIINSGDYGSVDVLADMLEEAGCDNEEILRHLRGEVRCAECGGDEIAIRDGPIFCTVCCNSGWLPKPVPCQPGCWVLRLLTENQPPPDQSVTFRAGEIEG